MRVLVFGSLLFALAFLAHVILWRVRLPKRQTRAVLLIFFGTLALGLLALRAAPFSFSLLGYSAPVGWAEYVHVSLFVASLTLAYMITYSAVEVDSPSLIMVLRIAEAGPEGLSREALDRELSDDLLLRPRLGDLLTDRMARLEGGAYRLTPKGTLMARLFILYRGLMGASKGG